VIIVAKIEMLGKKFGRWTVLEYAGSGKQKATYWKCLCECGTVRVVKGISLRRSSGNSMSCGCLQKEVAKQQGENNKTHGMSKTRTYNSWMHMVMRCNNIKDKNYYRYGGRGIKVCDRWLIFENFLKDMGKCPKKLTVERKDNNLGYFKENCIWATMTDQVRNRRLLKNNKTGINGVSWHKRIEKYMASITVKYKQICLGYFNTIKEAEKARKQGELKYWV